MSSLSISPDKQPAVIVVVFTLALMALSFTLFNNGQIRQVADFYGTTTVKTMETMQNQVSDASANYAALEARIAKLESQGPVAPVPAVPVN